MKRITLRITVTDRMAKASRSVVVHRDWLWWLRWLW
jgi:hypothetical protein